VSPLVPAALLTALGLGACEHRAEAEPPRPAETTTPIYDDRAFGPTDSTVPTSTPTPSPPAANLAPPGGTARDATASGTPGPVNDSVRSSAAHERFGGEYGARDNFAGASSSTPAGSGGTSGGPPRAPQNVGPAR